LANSVPRTGRGRLSKCVHLPAPRIARDNVDWVDYSYVNHYVGNGFVLLPAFRDRTDEHAARNFERLVP
jgi:agmatine deiminase